MSMATCLVPPQSWQNPWIEKERKKETAEKEGGKVERERRIERKDE